MRFLAVLFALLTSVLNPAWAQNAPFPPSPKQLVAVNPVTNKVYVANEFANTVTVLDRTNNTTTTIPVGSRPQFIVVNPLTNRIYVNNGGAASMTVIDGATDTNLTPTPLPTGTQGPMAVNNENNVVYQVRMTSVATDEVTFFNANNNTWYTIATESFQPTALTINPVTNTLYVAHYGTGDVRVISGAYNNTNLHPQTLSIPAWSKPFAIAANSVTNKVYVITEDARGPIGVIDGATNVATWLTPAGGHASGPKALAVNPVTNKIYAAFANEVVVIDGGNNSLTYVPVPTGSVASIAIDYFTNQVYVSNDGGNLTVINGFTNATTALTVPAGTLSIGVNPMTGEIIAGGATATAMEGATATYIGVTPTTSINPLPGGSAPSSGTITMSASNGSPNPLPIRGVYYQFDSMDGPWALASGAGNGPWTAPLSGLTAGSHTIYAFAAEAHMAPLDTGNGSSPMFGSPSSYAFTVTSASGARVSLASSVNPSTVGQSVTFTATVTASSGTPGGTVTFLDGSAPLCSAVVLASGAATCTTTALSAGAHTINANYSGDSTFGAASASVAQTVNKLSSSVTLSSTPNPSTAGQSVTITATITGSGSVPTGTVTFLDGTTTLCSAVALTSGAATCSTSSLSTGAHTLNANYSGNATYNTATGTRSQTVNATTPPPGPSTNVALAANGGAASASSSASSAFPASSIINGDRAGMNWGSGGGWKDATKDVFPDWVQVDFSGTKTIDRVVVYSLQDSPGAPVEPGDSMTFINFGVRDFTVQAWDGAAWVTLATVTGNNLVKRTVSFTAVATPRIRVSINAMAAPSGGVSRLVEVEAWTPGDAPPPPTESANVALAANGGSASASSSASSAFPASSIINGDRAGMNWGSGGGWKDATKDVFPDWVQVDFSGTKTIDRVVVYSLQDSPGAPVEPGDSMTFTNFGVRDFTVQAWNGTAWVTLDTVIGNDLVKRTVTFPSVATQRIRVMINAMAAPSGGVSRLVEIEAWGS